MLLVLMVRLKLNAERFFLFQATKMSEDLHTIGNLHVTKVSAELKMARSLVRVADIQATLQEQRYERISCIEIVFQV